MYLFSLNVLIPVSCSVYIAGVITSSSSITSVVSCFILYPHSCASYPALVHSPPPLGECLVNVPICVEVHVLASYCPSSQL